MFNFQINPQTGQKEASFQAKLVDIGTNVLQTKSDNPKNYKIVTVEFVNQNGQEVRRSAMCFEGNYKYGIEVNQTYLTTVRIDPQGTPQLQMSHLTQASRATADDFGLTAEVANVVPAESITNPMGFVEA